jgi:hypothetical protein
MGRLDDLDNKVLPGLSEARSNPRREAFARKYGWVFFLILAVAMLVHAIWAGRHYGVSDPIGYAEAGIFFAVSAFAFFRLTRR